MLFITLHYMENMKYKFSQERVIVHVNGRWRCMYIPEEFRKVGSDSGKRKWRSKECTGKYRVNLRKGS